MDFLLIVIGITTIISGLIAPFVMGVIKKPLGSMMTLNIRRNLIKQFGVISAGITVLCVWAYGQNYLFTGTVTPIIFCLYIGSVYFQYPPVRMWFVSRGWNKSFGWAVKLYPILMPATRVIYFFTLMYVGYIIYLINKK